MNDIEARERTDKINRAIRWYWANKEAIQRLLPLEVVDPETGMISVYVAHWNPEYWFPRWEDKQHYKALSLEEAEEKISGQLRPLFAIINRG